MEREFLDLVLVRVSADDVRMAAAPAWSHLPEGQVVLMEGATENRARGCVVTSRTVATDDDEYSFALALWGRKLYRIMTLVQYEDVDWGEEEDGDGD